MVTTAFVTGATAAEDCAAERMLLVAALWIGAVRAGGENQTDTSISLMVHINRN